MSENRTTSSIEPGLSASFSFLVPENKTVPHLYPEAEDFASMPAVFATGYMVGLVEWACMRALRPHLNWPAQQSVGTDVKLSHTAATPPGLTVTVQVRLDEVRGKRLSFSVSAHDGVDEICRGTHERYLIDTERFNAKVESKRSQALPASRVESFSTIADGQTELEVEVYQGEHSLCADNQHLGSYRVKGIPAARAGEQSIDVRFSYDLNGILEVDTTIVATETTRSLVLDRSKGGMSASDIKRARQQMQALKFHPRDALPNVTAIARAEAVLVDLVGPERARLLECLNAFRVALESQDPKQGQVLREILVALTSALRRGDEG